LPEPVAERVRRWDGPGDGDGAFVVEVWMDALEGCNSGLRMRGMMARWTGVGRRKPSLRQVWTRAGQRWRSEKVVVMDGEELFFFISEEEERIFGGKDLVVS